MLRKIVAAASLALAGMFLGPHTGSALPIDAALHAGPPVAYPAQYYDKRYLPPDYQGPPGVYHGPAYSGTPYVVPPQRSYRSQRRYYERRYVEPRRSYRPRDYYWDY